MAWAEQRKAAHRRAMPEHSPVHGRFSVVKSERGSLIQAAEITGAFQDTRILASQNGSVKWLAGSASDSALYQARREPGIFERARIRIIMEIWASLVVMSICYSTYSTRFQARCKGKTASISKIRTNVLYL